MGLCQCLHMISFGLLWANLSSSARGRAFASWANVSISLSMHPANETHMGPHSSLMRQPIVCLCQPTAL